MISFFPAFFSLGKQTKNTTKHPWDLGPHRQVLPGFFSTPEAPGDLFACSGFARCPGGPPGTCAQGVGVWKPRLGNVEDIRCFFSKNGGGSSLPKINSKFAPENYFWLQDVLHC